MEIREMIEAARKAQQLYQARFDQQAVDLVVRAAAKTIYDNAELLAREAVDETQMGVYEHKVAKNRNKSKGVWYNLRDKKSMGVLSIDERTGMIEIAKPIGVVAGITPMTNPIVTPMSKIIFALKTRNAIIIAPHPKSKRCSAHAIDLILEAIAPFGVPEGMVQVIREPSIEKTQELMSLADVVVATGGMAMVHSAYSSGKPSFGVGAGNVQVILDRFIDFDDAAEKVITGRSFDNGIICSGEQSFIYHKDDKEEVFRAFRAHGAYFVPEEDRDKVINAIFENGSIARDIVGKGVQVIAKKAGITCPEDTRVLVVESHGYGKDDMVSKEKMCPVMGAFPYSNFEEALKIAKTNLFLEGNGHTAGIHSNNQANIIKAGSEISVSRVIVNAPCATTAGGSIQNGLAVTNTLGCGSWGNNSISENFTYKHLLNITRIAPISARIKVPTDQDIWEY
ncbi:succinate-semialdehyde dehydrogenase, CoA-dependent [Porphyromonas crevioricanis JCM 15906]|uniref:Succinate-semialdehyde dehydrogenase n=2 Tax=Porphyromonas crevioricanis TaxID=393921 RepID=A0A2X4PIZ0_9PORP|nr:aldehyde dehydrogenase family protein [Porphyromonas crevioricanis]KGN94119.1 succinate-semialdehyde dehydrogenase [Porphyromonas crevioricanis]SJZ66085.1 succinate-semialdehyde dehydrogenase [Porphyromonas crevioricanis]SQH73926.1 Succinate-semialdehyde dehydrogenase (acetylating) [Porphyromonas crevioricanis]GAD04772.1 succinate-semialdehyde dehydrogenase, CoA-dependent [Porphyromonas crevioricanis JCM 15906]GAD08192.1 succinate-semialdehyde dehydrogenase, CoA-dependent [Porphyromonas cre